METQVRLSAAVSVESLIHPRRGRATSPEPRTVDRPYSTPDACIRRFDWLEGATGVRLVVGAALRLEAVRIAGDIDAASIDAIEHVLLEVIRRAPERVELDLSGVVSLDDAGRQMIARASQYARERRVALEIVRPQGRPM
jgi:hypothetical protein